MLWNVGVDEFQFDFLESREVHGVCGSRAGRHGVHAADGSEDPLLLDHGPQDVRDGRMLLVASQGLHSGLEKAKGIHKSTA